MVEALVVLAVAEAGASAVPEARESLEAAVVVVVVAGAPTVAESLVEAVGVVVEARFFLSAFSSSSGAVFCADE